MRTDLLKSCRIKIFEKITLDYPDVGSLIAQFTKKKPRSFHAYCVGLPRLGTHTIARTFKNNYRSDHEPYIGGMIKLIRKKTMIEKFL